MSEAFAALWASVVRTIVPVIVGSVLGFFAGLNLPVDPQFEVLLGTVLTTLFTGIYYIGVRLLETYVTPKFGWLLLFPKAPVVYSPVAAKDIEPAVKVATGAIEVAAAQVATNDTPSSKDDTEHPGVG